MNRLYIIIPLLLLAVFGGFYWNYSQRASTAEHAAQIEAERIIMEEVAVREAAERKAREDAEKRAAERAAAERAKEVERRAAWEADNRKIAEDTTRYTEQAEKNRLEVERLEAELQSLQEQHSALKADAFNLHQQIEQRRITRRADEIEHQRLFSLLIASYKEALLPEGATATDTTASR